MTTELIRWPGHGFVPPIFGAEVEQDEETEEETEGEETEDDPKKQLESLTETKNRLVAKLGKREKALKQLQNEMKVLKDAGKEPSGELRDTRLELAFLRAVMAHEERITDIETAWTLATARGYFDPVKIADDGTVEGMDSALNSLLDRYPYLVDEKDGPEPKPSIGNTGRAPNPRNRNAAVATSRVGLEKRMPVLRRQ